MASNFILKNLKIEKLGRYWLVVCSIIRTFAA